MQGSEQLSLPYLILQLMSFWQLATLMENLRKSPEIETHSSWHSDSNLIWLLETRNSKSIREEIWFQKFSFKFKRKWNFCATLWYEEFLGTDSWFWEIVHLAFWQSTNQQDPGNFS